MTQLGYDKSRFPNLQGELFDCVICNQVVKKPKECQGCGNLFCDICITNKKYLIFKLGYVRANAQPI